MRYFFTIILKAKRYPLSFLHKELDISGAIHTLDTMNHFFLAGQMIVIGRGVGVGRDKGDVEKDEEGLLAAKALGQRTAWLLKKLQS